MIGRLTQLTGKSNNLAQGDPGGFGRWDCSRFCLC